MNIAGYQQQLLTLLPRGQAWQQPADSELGLLMLALAEEFARIDARAKLLLQESLPSMVEDLLEEWEQDYGLPDTCTITAQTLSERRESLVQKYKIHGSQSREFLQELAAAIGFSITFTEYQHRRHGQPFGQPWYGLDWNFVIDINVDTPNADPYKIARLECVFYRLIHAHKIIRFNYIPPGVRQTLAGRLRLTQGGQFRVVKD